MPRSVAWVGWRRYRSSRYSAATEVKAASFDTGTGSGGGGALHAATSNNERSRNSAGREEECMGKCYRTRQCCPPPPLRGFGETAFAQVGKRRPAVTRIEQPARGNWQLETGDWKLQL